MLKKTEELVTEARLDLIAKEHRSIGSILDDRRLHNIEDVKIQTKRSIRQDIEKRIHARRGGRGEFDIKNIADLAKDSFKEKGINLSLLTGNYELEERIWKENSSKQAYSEKRKFQNPDLEQFYQNLNDSQRLEYKQLICEALIQLAEKYRHECKILKSEMDSSGIFHPEANAHRVHCIYLTKLYKGINCNNIEDQALKKMLRESQLLKEQEEELALKKEIILKDLEQKDMQKLRSRSEDNMNTMKLTGQEGGPVENTQVVKIEINENKNSNKKQIDENKVSLLNKTKGKSGKNMHSKSLKSLASTNKSSNNKLSPLKSISSGIKINEETQSLATSKESISQNTKPGVAGINPTKLFLKKLRHEKMGYIDSKTVLIDEASKLDNSEAIQFKRARDKSDLLDDKISNWMVNEVQSKEVIKTASGGIVSSLSAPKISSLTGVDSSTLIAHINSLPSTASYSPTKMLPFDEFYTILQNYSMPKSPDTNTKNSSKDSRGLRSPHSIYKGRFSQDEENVPDKKIEIPLELPISSSPQQKHIGHVEQTNIVKHIMDIDPKYESFLKISEQEQVSKKLLAKLNSNLTKPRMPRKVAPLGKEALSLTDSRGKASRMSLKGFRNVFKANVATESTPQTPHTDMNEYENGHRIIEMDVIDRLKVTKSDDDSYSRLAGALENRDEQDDSSVTSDKNDRKLNRSRSNIRSRQFSREMAIRNSSKFGTTNSFDEEDIPKVTEDMAIDMQSKLVTIWDSLKVNSHDRLNFMMKYSSNVYAIEMNKAVDLWAEVAVYTIILEEIIALFKKIKSGMILFPLRSRNVINTIFKKIHPLLASSSLLLVPPSIEFEMSINLDAVPLSAAAVSKIRHLIRSTFISPDSNVEKPLESLENALETFSIIQQRIASELWESLKKVKRDLEDIVPYGNRNCKDWLQGLEIIELI